MYVVTYVRVRLHGFSVWCRCGRRVVVLLCMCMCVCMRVYVCMGVCARMCVTCRDAIHVRTHRFCHITSNIAQTRCYLDVTRDCYWRLLPETAPGGCYWRMLPEAALGGCSQRLLPEVATRGGCLLLYCYAVYMGS